MAAGAEIGDPSRGYDALASDYAELRSDIGAGLVRDWAIAHLTPGARVLDVACGHGKPITSELIAAGFDVYAVDASARMLALFRENFPEIPVAQEQAQDGRFFDLAFDAVTAIGLIFLLSEDDQMRAIANMARALEPGGRLLFSAPWQAGEWEDNLTKQRSVSLGKARYTEMIERAGLVLDNCLSEEGENHHYSAIKPVS